MSSTNRGAVRSPNDFYVTDPDEITRFLYSWCRTDGGAELFWNKPQRILDPSAGGLTERVIVPQKGDKSPLVFEPGEMSYPTAIHSAFPVGHRVDTCDIRHNSRAAWKGDFLTMGYMPDFYDAVITNPPFALAIEFIQRALTVVKPGGYVVMLLRLNFFGSEERNRFFMAGGLPRCCYVHSKRLGFTPDGKTDSIEYMHAVWRKGSPCHETELRVMPYAMPLLMETPTAKQEELIA